MTRKINKDERTGLLCSVKQSNQQGLSIGQTPKI